MKHALLTVLAVGTFLAPRSDAQETRVLLRTMEDSYGPNPVLSLSLPASNGVGGYFIFGSFLDGIHGSSWAGWGSADGGAASVLVTRLSNVDGLSHENNRAWVGSFDPEGRVHYGALAFHPGGGPSDLRSNWLHDPLAPVVDSLVLLEGDSIPSLPGKANFFLGAMQTTQDGTPFWTSGIRDGTTTAVEGEGLFLGTSHTVLLKTGDPAPAPLPQDWTIRGNAVSGPSISAHGTHWINAARIALQAGGKQYVLVDGEIATTASGGLMGQDQPLSVLDGGLPGESLFLANRLRVTESGQVMVSYRTDAPSDRDTVLLKNGVVVCREGDVFDDGGTPVTVTGFDGLQSATMNEDGDLAHSWDTTAGGQVLILNDQVVLSSGDTLDWDQDGVPEATSVLQEFFLVNGLIVDDRDSDQVEIFALVHVDVNGTELDALISVTVDVESPFLAFCDGDGGDGAGCTDCPCGNEAPAGTVGGCLNSSGTSAELLPSGIASLSFDTVRFEVRRMGANTFGILSSAVNDLPNVGPCPPGSGIVSSSLDGLRCIGGNLIRHGTRPSDSNGDIGATTNGWGPPSGPAGGLLAQFGAVLGQTRSFQCFYREFADQGCLTGQNTTNAVRLTVTP